MLCHACTPMMDQDDVGQGGRLHSTVPCTSPQSKKNQSCHAHTGPEAEQWSEATASAAAGDIAALRLLTMDVVLSPSDGKDRCGVRDHSDSICAKRMQLH